MRKLGTAILGILLLTGAPAAGQTVGASAEQTFEASANWVVARTDNSARYHFINAYKSVNPIGATNTVADFGVVRCGIGSDGRVIITSCGVTTRIVFLRPDKFLIDPLLRSATVTLKENGVTHTAKWTVNDQPPTPIWALHGDGRGVFLDAAMHSGAEARGRLMGDRFSTKNSSGFASLKRGGEVNLFLEPTGASTQRTYVHRSHTRRAAWLWARALVRSLR